MLATTMTKSESHPLEIFLFLSTAVQNPRRSLPLVVDFQPPIHPGFLAMVMQPGDFCYVELAGDLTGELRQLFRGAWLRIAVRSPRIESNSAMVDLDEWVPTVLG